MVASEDRWFRKPEEVPELHEVIPRVLAHMAPPRVAAGEELAVGRIVGSSAQDIDPLAEVERVGNGHDQRAVIAQQLDGGAQQSPRRRVEMLDDVAEHHGVEGRAFEGKALAVTLDEIDLGAAGEASDAIEVVALAVPGIAEVVDGGAAVAEAAQDGGLVARAAADVEHSAAAGHAPEDDVRKALVRIEPHREVLGKGELAAQPAEGALHGIRLGVGVGTAADGG